MFDAADGGLARVRVPGGRLDAAGALALADAAERYGSGVLETTSRANVQLRGIALPQAQALAADLVAAGLALPDGAADERRNVMASPTAGVDPAELCDTGPLVTRAAAALAGLGPDDGVSHKFGVLVDAGGRVNLRGRRQPLCLAVVEADGEHRLAVHLGAAVPVAPDAQAGVRLAELDQLEDVVAAAARLGHRGTPGALDALLEAVPAGRLGWGAPAATTGPPLGRHPQRAPHLVSIGAAPFLGRLTAAALRRCAALAAEHGPGQLRLTPWRGVLLPDIPAARATDVVNSLADAGFVTDPADPAATIAACAGSTGCSSGLADTQGDAHRLRELLKARPPERRPRSVHLSGCPKGCAATSPAAQVTLVAGPEPGTYGGRTLAEALHQAMGAA